MKKKLILGSTIGATLAGIVAASVILDNKRKNKHKNILSRKNKHYRHIHSRHRKQFERLKRA